MHGFVDKKNQIELIFLQKSKFHSHNTQIDGANTDILCFRLSMLKHKLKTKYLLIFIMKFSRYKITGHWQLLV